jgi:hypothetical protein
MSSSLYIGPALLVFTKVVQFSGFVAIVCLFPWRWVNVCFFVFVSKKLYSCFWAFDFQGPKLRDLGAPLKLFRFEKTSPLPSSI